MKMVKCRHCFAEIPTGANRCRHCGGKQHLVLPAIVFFVSAFVFVFFGWHLYVVNDLKNRLSGEDISINAFTNTITLHTMTPPSTESSDMEFLAEVLGSSLAAKLLGPTLASEFNKEAKRRFDLYGMVIPWKVKAGVRRW